MDDEKCKDCQNCEYYIKATSKHDKGVLWILLFSVAVYLFGIWYPHWQESRSPKVNIYGHEVKIEDDSLARWLIDNGFCTADDFQNLIDSVTKISVP